MIKVGIKLDIDPYHCALKDDVTCLLLSNKNKNPS